MQYEGLLAFILLCSIACITPGPNNFIILSGSIRKGITKTLPEYFGISFGFIFMVGVLSSISSYLGSALLEKISFIKYFGIAFLLYLAYKIFRSKQTNQTNILPRKDTSFLQMFLFQWMNPKAWALAMSMISLVGPEYLYLPTIIFSLVIFPSGLIWLLLGDFIGKQILGTKYEVYINKIMALLLVFSVYFII